MDEREQGPPVVRRRDHAMSAASRIPAVALERAMHAGPVATVLVSVGGVCLAALLWDAGGGGDADGPLAQIAFFALSAAIALPIAFATWLASSWAFAERRGWGAIVFARYDAITYLAFAVFPMLRVAGKTPPGLAAGLTLAAFVLAKLVPVARFVPAVRDVAIVFASTRAIVFTIGWLAAAALPTAPGHGPPGTSSFAPWAQWDGAHYIAIADRGYGGTDIAFFPLFPSLVRIFGALFHSEAAAGVAISNVAFLIGLWFLRDIAMRLSNDEATASRALWYLAIFPASLFFTAVYSESVFFALTVATFAQLERRNWLFAGMLGGLAALTRLAGVFLIVPFLIEIVALMRSTDLRLLPNRRKLVDLLACAACIPLALLAFMLLEGLLTGDLLAFEHVQSHWQRSLSAPWTSVWRSVELVAHSHDRATIAVQAIELAFTALVVVLLVDGARLLKPSYWWYAVLSFLVPLSTSSLMSVPRFAAVVFPLFLVLARRGDNPLVDRLIVAFSLPLLGLFTAFFVTGHWVA